MLFPLTSPNLERIEIRNKWGMPELIEIEITSFLQSVASQSPRLQCLVIEGPLRGFTLQVLSDFSKLERLTMRLGSPDIPELFLQQLASSMPSLRSLHIKTTAPNSAQPNHMPLRLGQRHTISRLSFPSLETLDAKCDPSDLESIFGVLDAPLLKSVSLTLPQSYPNASADMHRFIERNGQVLKNTVHKVVITASVDPSLKFVKVFEQLKKLVVWAASGAISMSNIMDTFNDDGSWSRSLTHLRLRQSNQTNSLNCLSIEALRPIADACPNLKSLEISIIRPDEPEKQKDGLECRPHCLEKLVFLNLPSAWDDSTPLAVEFVSFLEHLFPFANPIYSGGKEDKPGALVAREAWWIGVRLMWELCQSIKDRKNDQPLSV